MAITQALCSSFKQELLNKEHDLDTDTYKIALYTSSATLDATTTAYSATNEVSGAGYTAAGVALTGGAISLSGTTAFVDFTPVVNQIDQAIPNDCWVDDNIHITRHAELYLGQWFASWLKACWALQDQYKGEAQEKWRALNE